MIWATICACLWTFCRSTARRTSRCTGRSTVRSAASSSTAGSPPQTLLPSTRSLAEDLKVGRNTVIAAYDQLLAEGFIEARAGSGTWVAPIKQDRQPAASPSRSTAVRAALAPWPDHRQRPAAAAQRRRHQLSPRRAGNRLLSLLHLVEPSGAQFALARREPARLPLLRRPSRPARHDRQQHQRLARHRLRARAGHRRHRRAGRARPRLARADGRGRPCLDGGAGLSRRQERLPRRRRQARAAEGRPPRLEPLRPRPAAAAPDLRHAVLPMAVRHHHAHRGAAATPRHRRAPRRLDHRGRLRRRIPLPRPTRAGAARPRSCQPRRLHRQLRQDAAAGAAHRLPDRAAGTGRSSFDKAVSHHRPVRAADPAGDRQRLHQAGLFRHPSEAHAPALRAPAGEFREALPRASRRMGDGLRKRFRHAAAGELHAPAERRRRGRRRRRRKGSTCRRSRSTTIRPTPEHGLLLGYAAMDERQILRAVLALRAAFMRLDRQ